MASQQVMLHLDEVTRQFAREARRIAFFVGFTYHATSDERNVRYELESKPSSASLQHLPPELSPERIREGRAELASWVVAQAVRDLVEAFEGIMVDPYYVGLLALRNSGALSQSQVTSKMKAFTESGGLASKCKAMQVDLGFTVPNARHFDSLTRVRNCLSHRRGVVGRKDCDEGADYMTSTWIGFDIYAELDDGRQIFDIVGKVLDRPATICARVVERSRQHHIGTRVVFATHELSEIIFTFTNTADAFVRGFAARLAELGVRVEAPQALAAHAAGAPEADGLSTQGGAGEGSAGAGSADSPSS